jgi:hypothetical protein
MLKCSIYTGTQLYRTITLIHELYFISVEYKRRHGRYFVTGCCLWTLININFQKNGMSVLSCQLFQNGSNPLAMAAPSEKESGMQNELIGGF